MKTIKAPKPGTSEICTDCELGRILNQGVHTPAAMNSHANCSGPCECGCKFSTGRACKTCHRSGPALDAEGYCIDTEDCLGLVGKRLAKQIRERQERTAPKPVRVRAEDGSTPTKGACLCGCGEDCGSFYKPGHDSRHLSSLAAAVKAGTMTKTEAQAAVSHSDKLVAKLAKRLGG